MKPQTNRQRPYSKKLAHLDSKKKKPIVPKIIRTNRNLSLSCSDKEWGQIMKNTKSVKGFGLKRSEILRKVLLNLCDDELLYTLGYQINKNK